MFDGSASLPMGRVKHSESESASRVHVESCWHTRREGTHSPSHASSALFVVSGLSCGYSLARTPSFRFCSLASCWANNCWLRSTRCRTISCSSALSSLLSSSKNRLDVLLVGILWPLRTRRANSWTVIYSAAVGLGCTLYHSQRHAESKRPLICAPPASGRGL